MGRKAITTEEFIEAAKKLHGDTYNYFKTKYTGRLNKVLITCPVHGDFMQWPASHLSGSGCRKCSRSSRAKGLGKFINESVSKFGKKFSYKNVDYRNAHCKVILECSIHGEFEIIARKHLQSPTGCPSCAKTGFNPHAPQATFYVFNVIGERSFVKFGITGKLNDRLATHRRNLKLHDLRISGGVLCLHFSAKMVQKLEAHIKSSIVVERSDIKGFKTEVTTCVPKEELLMLCKYWLTSNDVAFIVTELKNKELV